MARSANIKGKVRKLSAPLAMAGMALAIPAAGLAVVQPGAAAELPEAISYLPFTPARIDTQLAARVAEVMGEDGLRFTPASKPVLNKDRTVTVAVRVNKTNAQAISIRSALESVGTAETRERVLAVSPTSYNLGVARGYQSFAQPAKSAPVSVGLEDMGMPDLASFAPAKPASASKPSRFDSRLSLEKDDAAGRSPRTLGGTVGQSVDLSTSYRVIGSVKVTAGVRLSKDANRLAPLTDGVEDDQAVYVGTRVSF